MSQFKGLDERERYRTVKIDGKRIIIENVRKTKRTFLDQNNVPHIESNVGHDVALICDLCSAPIGIEDSVQLIDMVYHRDCGGLIVDEMLEQEVEHPGSFNASTMTQVYALRRQLRRERWGRRWDALRRLFVGRPALEL